jgi:hypothetical protein
VTAQDQVNAGASDESAIRLIIDARAKAVHAGDIEAMMADDVMIFDLVDPPRREGKPSSRQRAVEWVATYDGPISWAKPRRADRGGRRRSVQPCVEPRDRNAKDRSTDRHVVPNDPRLSTARAPLAHCS